MMPELLQTYGTRLLSGLGVTVTLVAISVTIGAIIGLAVAFARMSENRVLSAFAFAYVYFFRGTPLLAQVFLIYYGSGQFREALTTVGLWWFFRDAFYCCLLAFTLNTSAYQAEIYRGALRAVPRGQREAAMALGLNERVTFLKVVAPQALIVALRPLGNEIVLMIKSSAVAAVITVLDLMGTTRIIYARTFDISIYLWAGVFYFVLVEALRRTWDFAEARLNRHLHRA
jgi:polar amino acid transport system permease protein